MSDTVMETWSSIQMNSALCLVRHPEVRALARLEGCAARLSADSSFEARRSRRAPQDDRTNGTHPLQLRRFLQALQRFQNLFFSRHGRLALFFLFLDDLFGRVGHELLVAELGVD